MKRWCVETRATVIRRRFVMAENVKDAEAAAVNAPIDFEEDENEESMSVQEAPED